MSKIIILCGMMINLTNVPAGAVDPKKYPAFQNMKKMRTDDMLDNILTNYNLKHTDDSVRLSLMPKRDPFIPQLPIDFPEQTITSGQNLTRENNDQEKREVVIQPPPLNVIGVVWNSKRPQAIINNQVVSEGDMISEAKIISIKHDSIDILYREKTFTIKPNL